MVQALGVDGNDFRMERRGKSTFMVFVFSIETRSRPYSSVVLMRW